MRINSSMTVDISVFEMDGQWYADVLVAKQIVHTTGGLDDAKSAEWTAQDWVRARLENEEATTQDSLNRNPH